MLFYAAHYFMRLSQFFARLDFLSDAADSNIKAAKETQYIFLRKSFAVETDMDFLCGFSLADENSPFLCRAWADFFLLQVFSC